MTYHKSEVGFGLVGLLIIFVVLIGLWAAGYYVWSKQPVIKPQTETSSKQTFNYAGWKTYTSRFGGFTMKYPADWYFLEFDTTNADLQYYQPFDEVISLEPLSSQTSTTN